ncbi:MAG: hypothetical protein LBC91_00590 [Candidatus Accumulibacter sp.]|jgi:hypothetical protein|nr:hypothetical protein [Accumulibacter sp.]
MSNAKTVFITGGNKGIGLYITRLDDIPGLVAEVGPVDVDALKAAFPGRGEFR